MRISVAIINYNYGRYLSGAIGSVLEQTRPADEIVVVDDGSTDDSRKILTAYEDPVTVLLSENRGPASASSTALARCTGDVVLQLDADDLMHPTRIARVESAYKEFPAAQWAFHRLTHIRRADGEPIDPQPALRRFTDGFHDFRRWARHGWLPVTMPATSGLSWRRDFLRRLLPIPQGVKVHDNYLKFASLATAPGVFIDAALGDQGMHESNFYAQQRGRQLRLMRARNSLSMLPGFRALGSELGGVFGRSFADAWVQSRGTLDFTAEERSQIRAEFEKLTKRQRISLGARLAGAAARQVRS